jgi:DNA-binding NarL/FixJ family response regulator
MHNLYQMKIRLAIVDDKTKNRLPLAGRLGTSADIEVVFTAGHGMDFLEQAKINQPIDVVLMDIEMPEMDGIKAVETASALYPETKFIMLTVFDDEDRIFEAIKAGACGYLLKDDSATNILEAIMQAKELGGAPMSPGIARKALALLSKATIQKAKIESIEQHEISEREMEILKLIVSGLDYKAIAEKMFLSGHTVRKHIANIYTKLHVHSKSQAIRVAVKKGWV